MYKAETAFLCARASYCIERRINLGKPMKTYTGKEMAAKMRDGEFDRVETLAPLRTYDASGNRKGTATATRVEIPEATLGGRLGKIKFHITRTTNSGAVVVELIV